MRGAHGMAGGTSTRRIFRERTGSTSPARQHGHNKPRHHEALPADEIVTAEPCVIEDPAPEQVLVPRELFERALALVRERRTEAEQLHDALERAAIAESITAMMRDRVKFLEGQLAAYRVSAQKPKG